MKTIKTFYIMAIRFLQEKFETLNKNLIFGYAYLTACGFILLFITVFFGMMAILKALAYIFVACIFIGVFVHCLKKAVEYLAIEFNNDNIDEEGHV